MKRHDCIITDMDQVICLSQVIHGKVESEILAAFGKDVKPEEIASRFTGMGTEYVFEHYLGASHVKQALADKETRLQTLTASDILEVEGAVSFFKAAKKRYRVGLDSGSSLAFIRLVVESLGLSEILETIASGEEVLKGKPEPDVFLLALERLGCDPRSAIIVEDGTSGIIAAKRIGATAIGITTSYSSEKLKGAGADYVVESFQELTELLKL